jgi:tetratricopeptide (TPR) repeat protein
MRLKQLVEGRRYREALECYRAFEAGDQRLNPENQWLAADAAARLGELAQSQELCLAALPQYAAGGQHTGLMQVTNLLGVIAFERGQVSRARGFFSDVLQTARLHEDQPILARVNNNLGSLLHLSGDTERAIPLYRESARLFRGLHDGQGEAEASHNLGQLLRQTGRLEEAGAAAAEAVRLADASHVRSLQALVILGQAEIEIDRGRLDHAGRQVVRGAAIAGEAGDQFTGLEAGRLRVLISLRRGDFAVAHHLAEIAASIAGTLDSALLRAECTALSALALKGLRRAREAEARQAEAVGAFQDLRAGGMIERFQREWNSMSLRPVSATT